MEMMMKVLTVSLIILLQPSPYNKEHTTNNCGVQEVYPDINCPNRSPSPNSPLSGIVNAMVAKDDV